MSDHNNLAGSDSRRRSRSIHLRSADDFLPLSPPAPIPSPSLRTPPKPTTTEHTPASQPTQNPTLERDYSRWRYRDDPLEEDGETSDMHHNSRSRAHTPTRPLIDQVTNAWQKKRRPSDSAQSSTSETSDIQPHDWNGTSRSSKRTPKWVRKAQRAPGSISRNTQRWLVAVLAVALLGYFAYRRFMAPRWREEKKLDAGYSASETHDQNHNYGASMPVALEGVIQIKTLPKKHIPTSHGKGRLVFVGDIHGCKEELLKLLEKVGFDRRHDHLVTTGDVVSKGPDSPGVVDVLRGLDASCVRGNHEDRVLLAREQLRRERKRKHRHALQLASDDILGNEEGDVGDERALSKAERRARRTARQLSEAQAAYLSACPVILRVGVVPGMGEVFTVHAGLVPGVEPRHQDPYQVMNMRSIDAGTRVPSAGREYEKWDRVWGHYQGKQKHERDRGTVVYGHDSKTGLNIRQWTKGLDSGCVNGERLSALVVDAAGDQEVVSVKCREGNRAAEEDDVGEGAARAEGQPSQGLDEQQQQPQRQDFLMEEQDREKQIKEFWLEERDAPPVSRQPCFMD